jgi:hypothetical protein
VLGSVNGDFTPYGYLRNPGHRATSWRDTRGGNLLTSTERVGMEWVYPVARDPKQRVGLGLQVTVDGRVYQTRSDFEAFELTSRYHSCLIFGFDWHIGDVSVEARYFLVGEDALCVRVSAKNQAGEPRRVNIDVVGWLDADGVLQVGSNQPLVLSRTPEVHAIVGENDRGGADFNDDIPSGGARCLSVVLSRGRDLDTALDSGSKALGRAVTAFGDLLAADAAFYAGCPALVGDWPDHWREGLAHDLETTRLLVQPAGGIFADVWPAWMASWPRVVLAEGVLDMLRLAYADPALAQRAVLSMFRDAPRPNVPCVFETGEFNMLAVDGSQCGTSPAWCLPFVNLELLYLRSLDRDWLRQLYPYLSAFLTWWLEYRTDAEGWAVYKCTWEAGEDGNPRLDPTGTGDADISSRVRPVELQATMAHAAGVLAFFAEQLALVTDVARWREVEASYVQRTRRLFDTDTRRYRDWLVAERRFQKPCPELSYWGVDPCRESAQSLTPLLIGEPVDEAEVWRHARPPWTLWPSWTLSLVESAASAGWWAGVGRLAFETIDRVYRVTTRRDLLELSRPLPGCAPEFWPLDWRTYDGNDAYGWGATTANLLIRHLFGFKESRATDGWVADLTPSLAQSGPGQRLGIRHLNYRGLLFDLSYTVLEDGLEATLDTGSEARRCTVSQLNDTHDLVFASGRAASRHQFRIHSGQGYSLRLE